MKKKTLDFSDIEDISQTSSSVQSHHPSPPRDIKREPVELPQTLDTDRIVQNKNTFPQQRTYWQVAFDDLDGEDVFEEPLNAVLIQEEQLPQILPEPIEEPQYIEQYFEDFNQNHNQEIEPTQERPKQKSKQPQQQKMTINTMNNNNTQNYKGRIYNPKKSLIYLRLQGKEDLYRKQENTTQDPLVQDELIDDLVCISNLMLNLSVKRQKIEQNEKPIMQIHQIKKKPTTTQPKEETKETRKVPINDIKQQTLDRQKRIEQLQQQKQLLKILNQKQVYDITTKKLCSSGMVLYRVKLKEKQRDFVQWLRFSEIAQISKGLESIFAFEKRLCDQHFYKKQNIKGIQQHRIVGGQLLKGIKVYQNAEIFDNQYQHKPLPNKSNEEETKITVNKARGSRRRNLSDIVLEHEKRKKLAEEQKNELMEDENIQINQEQENEQEKEEENELNSDEELIRKQNEEERRKRRADRVRQRRQILRIEKELLEQEKKEFQKHQQQQQNQRDSIQKSECKSNKSENKSNGKEKDQSKQKKIKKEHDLLDADEIKIFKVNNQNERQHRVERREQQNTSTTVVNENKKHNTNAQKPKPLFKTAPVLSRLETTEQLKKKQIILDKRKLKQLKEESKKNNEIQLERKSEQRVETRKSVQKQEVKKQPEYVQTKRQYDLPTLNSRKKNNRRKIIDDDTSEEVIKPQQRNEIRKLVRI